MKHRNLVQTMAMIGLILAATGLAFGAYHHMGEDDSGAFLAVYPDKTGTKLDSCNLCHSGGQYTNSKGQLVTLGSCQWCHYSYGYDASGNIDETLNGYGKAYKANGSDQAAVEAIKILDSDGDGYSNQIEIAATRYPGDGNDDPSKVAAPYRVYSLEQLETMPQHEQFLLMNTHKSDDHYAEYSGVPVSDILRKSGILASATDITVYAPDGFSQFHPLSPDPNPLFYHVNGTYPQATYYYDAQADISKSAVGWCDYSAPSCTGRINGDVIYNEGGLKMLLAFERDGQYLTPGVLTPSNKLDGEGPFRIVPPQKNPGPPDQKSTSPNQAVIWPFDDPADHNAGFSSRSTTIIKVGPLPAGTTDIDVLEAGWNYIDARKLIIYGAIDPLPTVKEKMRNLVKSLCDLDRDAFKSPLFRGLFIADARVVQKMINKGHVKPALNHIEHHLLRKTDGCTDGDDPDRNDWIADCDAQKQVYWSINEIDVLLKIAR
ncbi:MAG: hypothetical protein CVU57_09280 [Deltaproteobacteria bacterium HGW-Deltaproteobacteria-15]|nr:MAG: hypothetical protein CVU57_09280 [Deltaproteobacteria bacterium HGW-Deltaproteobacteria-15]